MKSFNKNKESLYLHYLDGNNLYGLDMSQKLSVNRSKWESKYNEKCIKSYDEDSNRVYVIEVDLEYPKNLIWFAYWPAISTWKNED